MPTDSTKTVSGLSANPTETMASRSGKKEEKSRREKKKSRPQPLLDVLGCHRRKPLCVNISSIVESQMCQFDVHRCIYAKPHNTNVSTIPFLRPRTSPLFPHSGRRLPERCSALPVVQLHDTLHCTFVHRGAHPCTRDIYIDLCKTAHVPNTELSLQSRLSLPS